VVPPKHWGLFEAAHTIPHRLSCEERFNGLYSPVVLLAGFMNPRDRSVDYRDSPAMVMNTY